jgi:mono/diheme cytochrome c family protein
MRQMPPDFAAIARYRTPDQIRDRIMFPAMHVNMPRWPDLLRADEIDALVAYVAGLSG